MKEHSLNGFWQCTFPDGQLKMVEVPGCFDKAADRWDIAEPVIYERTFSIEEVERYARIRFSGVSYYCDVYVNGICAGSHEGMWDSFSVDVTSLLHAGENCLRVEVTKSGYDPSDRFPLRQVLSGFIPDVLCTFGGIWDEVQVETTPVFFVDHHSGTGDCQGDFTICAVIDSRKEVILKAEADVFDASGKFVAKVPAQNFPIVPGQNSVNLKGLVNQPALWSLDEPNQYTYILTLSVEGQSTVLSRKLAFREIKAEGTAILLNGRPVYMRGILHWGYYDEDIIPNPTEEVIRDEIQKIRAYGFNAIKHCLYIPRQRYFDLADEAGVLLWVELPLWLPEPTGELENRIKREYPRILEALKGHPSVGLVSLGCELDDTVSGNLLSEMYDLAKRSTGALVRDNSGSGECYGGLAVDYADFFDYHFYAELQNMENLMETFTPGWRNRRPWVFGEFCDSDTLRDLKDIREKEGVASLPWELADPKKNPISRLKPDFYLGEHDVRMEKYGIRENFNELHALSIDHAMVHRKVTLEQTRSFPEVCGYNITSIRDVPIATSGLFDDLMEPKFDYEAMRAINGDVMLLPAWDLSRVWINADRVRSKERYNFTGESTYSLHVLVSNYGAQPIDSGILSWQLRLKEKNVINGAIPICKPILQGEVAEAGYVSFQLPKVTKPATYILHVSLEAGMVKAENEWPVFVYPALTPPQGKFAVYDPCNLFYTLEREMPFTFLKTDDSIPEGTQVVITSLLTNQIKEYMKNGGNVFLLQRDRGTLPTVSVAFWREGIVKQCTHPILAEIEKTTWMDDLRYFGMSTGTAFDTEEMAGEGYREITTILRRFDCRRWLASDYMLSFRLGKGECVALTLRLEGGMGKEPLYIRNNPYGLYLLYESLRYLLK